MKAVFKSGRLSNGMEKGKGCVVHLADQAGFGYSLCKSRPGPRSAQGFIETEKSVNCERCLKRNLTRMEAKNE